MIILIAVLAIGSGAVTRPQGTNNTSSGNLAAAIRSASGLASGSRLCDRTLAAKQKHIFDSRYGARIRKLKDDYASWHGPDAPLTVVSSCVGFYSHTQQEVLLKKALTDFNGDLSKLEHQYSKPVK